MLPNRDEYMESLNKKKPNGETHHFKMIQQAAVKAELLTGVDHWDTFLSYLQAVLEVSEGHRLDAQEILCHPNNVDHSTMLRAKIALAECESRIGILRAVMSLPKDLIEMGNDAKSILERVDKANSAS